MKLFIIMAAASDDQGRPLQFWKKNGTSSYTQPTHLIFGTANDIVGIFYRTKNLVRGLYIGGDMVIGAFKKDQDNCCV